MPKKRQVQQRRHKVFAEVLDLLKCESTSLFGPFDHEPICLQRSRPMSVLVEASVVR